MELIVESDIYAPTMDDLGNYIDKIPSFIHLPCGLRCPCGSRKDKVYETSALFSSHIKTKKHKSWLISVNLNKTNYYVENEKLKETIQNQKMIIATYEKALNNKKLIIHSLLQQMPPISANDSVTVNNLLEFD